MGNTRIKEPCRKHLQQTKPNPSVGWHLTNPQTAVNTPLRKKQVAAAFQTWRRLLKIPLAHISIHGFTPLPAGSFPVTEYKL